jgi:TonB family protein
MKWRLLLLSFLCIGVLKAQKSDTLTRYFTSDFEPTTKAGSAYEGKVFPQGTGYGAIVADSAGRVLMTGTYRDRVLRIREGLFTFYHPNGTVQMKGSYTNNRQAGDWLGWHANGQIKDSVGYNLGEKQGRSRGWHDNGQLMYEGFYFAGFPDSTWSWYYPNGQPSTKEKYRLNKLTSLECFDSLGNKTGSNCSLELPPTIQGRYGGLQKYIMDSLYYPAEALQRNIQGVVEVQFTITKEGKLKDIKYLNSPDKLLSDEVTRVLLSVPAWYPAIRHNQMVDQTQNLKIPFYRPGSSTE